MPTSSARSSRRRWIIALGLMILAALWLTRRSPSPAPVFPAEPAPVPRPVPIPTATATATATPPPTATAIATTLATNLQPGRIAFLTITFDPDHATARVTAARGTAGRAKAFPPVPRAGQLRVDAFDATGQLTFSTSVEDPTARHVEHPSDADPGLLTTTVFRDPDAPLHLRLPGESRAARLVFYRLSADAPSATTPWAPVATLSLPTS